ncbi:hypothetical protein UFOVP164_19 [uncultured Caudovirales phage]|uniref:Uncharacterized protein n=1 Tax=uncultured Caudovirales phage TaxID=2100421 RepID=A0A6J7XPV6_9CAUD|nr:hypothetical protein UFOVP164_19 [uncultured Caudovirales phage]
MKRPSFQFYPSDWLRDTALRSCSTGARGLWIDMICFMHEGSPYGYLKVADKVILPSNLARMVGETLEVVEDWLHELEEAGVFDVENGAIYSRRMIRDEELRQKRAEGGKLGGNPNLKVNHEVISEVKQKPTPSSSSSSSSSSTKKKESATSVACPLDVSPRIWEDWLALRKKKSAPVTQTVIEGAKAEADKLNWSLEKFLIEWCTRGSQGLKAEWIQPKASFAQQAADIIRTTVPASNEPDAALEKIKADAKTTRPPTLAELAKMAELRKKA